MKISYVTETWPPEINGVALTAARVVKDLRHRGHNVELVRPRQHAGDNPNSDTVLVTGVPIPMYPQLKAGLPSRRRLLRRWRDSRPDVVHVATEGPLGWSACSAAIQLGIPVTSDFRTRFDEYSDAYGMKALVPVVRSYLRSFHNRTLCTFVPTQEIATHLEHHGFNDLVVSGRGVDTIAFSPLYRSETLRRSWKAMGPVALYVGRLAAEKNLFAVVEAFEAMRSIEPNAKLVLVGDGPLRDALKERCPDAIFAGMQCGADLAAHYASADIFLFASLTETFGNVTLEAMACGLPVVAYDIAAAAIHIRDGCNGITVSPGDHAAFSAAAMRLAYNEPLRERLGEAARLTARGAGWDRILADFESALLAATSSANSDVSPCLV